MADDPNTGSGAGNDGGQQGAGGGFTPPPAPPPAGSTTPETVTREQYDREMDRQRDRYGKEKQSREAAEKQLAELLERTKTEEQRLAEKAAKADQLAPRLAALEGVVSAQLASITESLAEEMRDLIPADAPIEVQLATAQKLLAAQSKLAPPAHNSNGQPVTPNLPPAGGRNPQPPGNDDQRAWDEAAAMFPTLSRQQPARKGQIG